MPKDLLQKLKECSNMNDFKEKLTTSFQSYCGFLCISDFGTQVVSLKRIKQLNFCSMN